MNIGRKSLPTAPVLALNEIALPNELVWPVVLSVTESMIPPAQTVSPILVMSRTRRQVSSATSSLRHAAPLMTGV